MSASHLPNLRLELHTKPIRESNRVKEALAQYPDHFRWIFSDCAHCRLRYAAYRKLTPEGPDITIREGYCSEGCQKANEGALEDDARFSA